MRIEFFRPDEGMKVYHLGRGIIMDLAEEAGVLYKVDRSSVINKELFDQNLQNYKVEPGRRHDVCRKIPLEHLDKGGFVIKTKDELNRLKEETITQNKKLAELSTAELAEVSGGGEDVTLVQYTLPPKELYTIRMTFWMKFGYPIDKIGD